MSLADLEKRNVFKSNLVFEINKDFSGSVADEGNLNLSVDLNLVSISINFGCASQVLVSLKL